LNQLKCKPSNAVFIGDSQVDMIAAHRAKVIPIYIDRKKKTSRKFTINPETYIKFTDLNQIFNFIEDN